MGEIFQYRSLTQSLATEIVHILATGESVVVLGPRNSGKVFLRNKIIGLLALEKITPVISVKFQAAQPILSRDQAYERIREGMKPHLGVNVPELKEDCALLSPILEYGRETNRLPILLASNVDAMSHIVAREFLREVRSAVSTGKLVVMLTGAYDLRDLVFGPNSEFNVAHQYVLQGLGREYFEEHLEKYAKALDIRFESDEAREELWRITGGSGYGLRVLLWLVVERRARQGEKNSPVTAEQIRSWPDKTSIMGPDEAHMLRTAIRLIPLEPNTWENLRKMIKDGRARLINPSGKPGALTLSGLAQRTHDGYLEFASPLLGELARRYFDDLRFGDLYACACDWNKAKAFYSNVDQERRLRPVSSEDRPEVGLVIRSVCASFHSQAEAGTKGLCSLFEFGCRSVLGFPEVTFWQPESKSEWTVSTGSMEPSSEGKKAAAATLVGGNVNPGPVPVASEWQGAAFAFVLEPGPSGSPDAVLVGDFQNKILVSREREKFFEDLADHFRQAYAQAIKQDRLRRHAQKAMAAEILLKIGQDNLTITNVFEFAREEFHTLGYRLMGYSLVYLTRQQIEQKSYIGALQHEVPKLMFSNKDEEEFRALHQEVIQRGNNEIVKAGSCVVVPIKSVPLEGKIQPSLGALRLEREDQASFSETDLEDLTQYGRQLATVLTQIRRIHSMERAVVQRTIQNNNILLARFIHDIAQRWNAMDSVISQYRLNERKYLDLQDLNKDLLEEYAGILNVAKAAKEKLWVVRPNLRTFDACEFFHAEMKRLVTERLVLKIPLNPVLISADKDQLATAIIEIVQNAREMSDPAVLEIRGSVELIDGDEGLMIRFTIEDNGPGVKPDLKLVIFNEFYSKRPPGTPEGTGVGLAQVKRISEAHGGQVRENGIFGKGARFEIDIPLAKMDS